MYLNSLVALFIIMGSTKQVECTSTVHRSVANRECIDNCTANMNIIIIGVHGATVDQSISEHNLHTYTYRNILRLYEYSYHTLVEKVHF